MLQSLMTPVSRSANPHTWTFFNDTRLVGELTAVTRMVPSGLIVEGWATIAAHQSSMAEGGGPGMCLIGPVYDSENRAVVLDSQPVFWRLESR